MIFNSISKMHLYYYIAFKKPSTLQIIFCEEHFKKILKKENNIFEFTDKLIFIHIINIIIFSYYKFLACIIFLLYSHVCTQQGSTLTYVHHMYK